MTKTVPRTSTGVDERSLFIFFNSHLYHFSGRFVWDLQTEEIFCSDVMLALSGSHQAGTQCLIYPDDIHFVHELIQKISNGIPCDHSFRVITSFGEVHHINVNGTFISYEVEKAEDLIHQPYKNFIRERNADKQAETDELQLQAYRNAERISLSGIWHINTLTYEIFYSDGIFRLHGLPVQSLNLHLHTFHSFIYPDDREAVIRAFDLSYKEQVPISLEYRIMVNKTEVKWVSHVTRWFFNNRGELILSGMMQDISGQKTSELNILATQQELKLQENMLMHSESIVKIANWHLNLLTRKINYSDNIFRIYGLKPGGAPLNANLLLKFVHPEDQEMMNNVFRQILYEHSAPDVEYRIIRPDGKTRFLRQKGKLIIDSYDEMVMIGTIADITDQKIAERKLSKFKSFLSLKQFTGDIVEEQAHTGSWIMDMDSGDMTWSRGMPELLGFRKGSIQINQRVLLSVIHPEDKKEFVGKINIVQEGTPLEKFTIRIGVRSEIRYLMVYMQVVSFDDKSVFICTFQDKTSEKQTQELLSEQQLMSDILSDASSDKVFAVDINNYIIRWNQECEVAFGLKKDKVIGKNFFDVFPRMKIQEMISRFQKASLGEKIQLKGVKSVFGEGYQDMLMMPLKDKQEKIFGVLIVIHDMTHEFEMRRQLTDRLQFIEKLLESSVDRIIVLDRNMNYRYWNTKAELYYGISRNEVVGRNILELFPGFVDDPSYESFRNALRGETVHIPASKNLDNKKGYFETYLIPIKDDNDNEVTGILWIVHDLAGEFRLALQQRKANHILESINECYAEVDFNGTIRYVNPKAESFWQKSKQDLLGKNILDLFDIFNDNEAVLSIMMALEKQEENTGEFYSESNKKWVYLSCTVTAEGVILLFYDISERKKTDEMLELQNKIYEHAEEIANMGTWTWNPETNQAYYSDKMYKLFGLEPHEVKPGFDTIPKYIHDDDRERVLGVAEKLKEGQQPMEIEYRVIRKDGVERIFRNRIKRISTEKGDNIFVGTTQDITEEKLLYRKLERKTKY